MNLAVLRSRIESIRDGEIVFEPQLKILLLQCLDYMKEEKCGEWLECGYGTKCSICGARNKAGPIYFHKQYYCPRCGAKMEKDMMTNEQEN